MSQPAAQDTKRPFFGGLRGGGIGSLTSLLVVLLVSAAHASSSPGHRFIDDLGSPVESSLDVCFLLDDEAAKPRCTEIDGLEPLSIDPREPWTTLEVEGSRHGPIALSKATVTASSEIVVPRKALVQLTTPREIAPDLQVSLWDVEGERWQRPVLRWRAAAGERRWVVARGPTLVSISDGRNAPLLEVVELDPGSRHAITVDPRPGWSAILLVRDADRRPVDGAHLRLTEPEGWAARRATTDRTPRRPRLVESTRHGVATVEGLRTPYLALEGRHPDYRPYRGTVVGSGDAAFAIHPVDMLRGATLDARIRHDAEPASAASCQLVTVADDGSETTVASAAGPRCLFERAAPGSALLRVALDRQGSEPRSAADVAVTLVDDAETRLELDLQRLEISGSVERGDLPAEGVELVAFADDGAVTLGSDRPSAEATTDQDGAYTMTLWRPGAYRLFVLGPGDVPAGFRRLEVFADEIADFALARAQVTGRVVDERRDPVAGATLQLRWTHGSRTQRLAKTDADGRFAFALATGDALESGDTGTADLHARHPGFQSKSLEGLSIDLSTEASPLELVLHSLDSVTLDVETHDGRMPAGLWALSFAVELDGRLRFVDRAASDTGSLTIRRADSRGRVFVGGAGCALSAVEIFETETSRWSHRCPAPSNLVLRFEQSEGRPHTGLGLLLRHDGAIVPESVVTEHLRRLGLPTRSTIHGTLAVPALAPGRYDLFLAGVASEPNVLRGVDHGFLDTVVLVGGGSQEQIIELDLSSSR